MNSYHKQTTHHHLCHNWQTETVP